MATCDLGYEHEDLAPAEAEPAPIVVEPGPNENDVKIAEIQAEQSIETAKIYAQEGDEDLRAEVERLRGQVSGMQTVLDRVAPEPELEPEPEPAPAPTVVVADDDEGTPPPPPTDSPAGKSNSGGGWWAGYR